MPIGHQAMTWTHDDLLSMELLGTTFITEIPEQNDISKKVLLKERERERDIKFIGFLKMFETVALNSLNLHNAIIKELLQ